MSEKQNLLRSAFLSIGLVAVVISAYGLLLPVGYRWLMTTTIGTDVSTSKLVISKTTSDLNGALDLDITAGATGISGTNISMTSSSDYDAMYGSYVTVNGGPTTGFNGSAAYAAQLKGNASSTGGNLVGLNIENGGATSGGANLIGSMVTFSGEFGTQDITGAGGSTLYSGLVKKTVGAGNIRGLELDITNSSASSSAEVEGVLIEMDVSGDSNLVTSGIFINESGASGTLDDGVLVRSNRNSGTSITDALDVSDSDILNAINIGTNHVIAGNTGAQSPAISACGTNPSSDVTDFAGRITVGSGTITACTITFKVAYTDAPHCVVTGNDVAVRYAVTSSSASAITVSSSADMSGDTFYYICIGR